MIWQPIFCKTDHSDVLTSFTPAPAALLLAQKKSPGRVNRGASLELFWEAKYIVPRYSWSTKSSPPFLSFLHLKQAGGAMKLVEYFKSLKSPELRTAWAIAIA